MPGFRKYAKKVARGGAKFARKVGKNVRKRYSGKSAIPNLLKDVSMLKHLVNIEKKRFDITAQTAVTFAQSNTTGVSGQYAINIGPTPGQGAGQSQRVGNSIKLVSGCLDMSFSQQASTLNNLKVKWWLVCRPDNSSAYTASTSIAQFFEPNPFSGVNDYYSSRDPEYFTAFKVIKTGTIVLHQDQISGGAVLVQKKYPLKFNHHLKYNTDGTTTTTKNQMILFVQCSGGDVFLTTGATLQYNMRWYYTDN